jgi:signal peptidase I
VSILIFLIVAYILMSITLMKLFEKAGVDPKKALIPGVNFVEWCKLIGQPAWHAALLLIPIVNIFIYAGMKVDLVRSFGRYKFSDSAIAVIFSPIIFWLIGKSPDDKYIEPIVPKEKAYRQELHDAHKKRDKFALSRLEKSPYRKGQVREWIEAIVFAVFAAAFIRMFLIEAYVIPTSSMEGSLLVGDYLFVSKAHYGIRTPMTVLQVPLLHNEIPYLNTESYVKTPKLGYHRLPAVQSVQRNQPFVFNWPVGDSIIRIPNRSGGYSVMQARQNINYYQSLLKSGQIIPSQVTGIQSEIRFFEDKIKNELTVRPIDKKDHYIKRCVGIGGDVLEVKDRKIYINGQEQPFPEKVQFKYKITGFDNKSKLMEMGVKIDETEGGNIYALNNEQVNQLKNMNYTPELVPQNEMRYDIFPQDTTHFKWTLDNFGPLTIPAEGQTLNISVENIALYERIIRVYENNTLEVKGNDIYINGSKATSYTFKQNYYWAMGDNRHMSEDSRFWGFVPHDHIVGKPLFIWMSSGYNGIRWNRIFTSANKP